MSLLFSFTLPLAAALSPTDRLALELDSVLSALSGHARTRPGAALCNKLPFANTAADARTAYTAVGDALSLDRKLWPPMAHPLDTIVSTLQTLQVESRVPLAHPLGRIRWMIADTRLRHEAAHLARIRRGRLLAALVVAFRLLLCDRC